MNIIVQSSPYGASNQNGYTKHYFVETERFASRIGDGSISGINTHATTASALAAKQAKVNNSAPDSIMPNSFVYLRSLPFNWSSHHTTYWQHSDHLGSASWVTDTNGAAYQHLQYMPWGEPLLDQRKSGYTYNSRYTFSGKERDEETGYSYFGARYYNSDLSIWLSVDPLADKYPGLSPYTYCANNPVKLVDPDGRGIWEFDDSGNLTKVGESDFDEFHKVDYHGNRTGESLFFERKVVTDDFCIDGKHSSSYYIEVENTEDAFTIFSFMAKCAIDRGGEFAFAVTENDMGIVGGDKGAIIGESYAMGNLLTHNKRGYVFTEAWHNHYDNGCPSQYEPGIDDIRLASQYPGISFYILTQRGSVFYDGQTPPAKLCPEERRNLLDLDGFEITAPDPKKH